ncbi:MAG: thiolase family protein [Sorangiineae bacterium]|nr:thiolase family protein [Polyangiaceae bacterium]MEB2324386.1 thiolase family protein [Sorangiineae bacterium]
MADIAIIEAVRSAVGKAGKGSLAHKRPDELAGEVIAGLLARVPALEPDMIDDVVLGCAMPEGEQGLNVARVAALLAGLPVETGGMTVNRFCSSGLQAIAIAAGAVALGSHEIVVAGGVESMSMVPMTGNKISVSPVAMSHGGGVYTPMGITAENVAQRFEVSREAQDAFALESQQKAARARAAGNFEDEVVTVRAVRYEGGKHVEFDFRTDELIRPDTTLEGLARLKPSFAVNGSVTPGNASPLSDGAAAALVMSKEKAAALGIRPRAWFRHFTTAGVDPTIMGIGPIPAVEKLFRQTGLAMKDIDVIELNEAFASQSVVVKRKLDIPSEKLNPSGGAIALGHPLGCTGAKLVATIIRELERRKARRGIVTMCIGGGMGAAGLIELA